VYNEELGKWIPEGWGNGSISELIKLIGGGTPKTSVDEYWNGDIGWFSVTDAPNDSDVFVFNTVKKITKLGLNKSSTKLLREGITIISARGTVGKCALVGKEVAMNQSCYGIESIYDHSDIFNYYLIRTSVNRLQNNGHGSVFNTITRETFSSIKTTLFPNSVTIQFDVFVKSLFDKIKLNGINLQSLTAQRNVLLAQLISGKTRLPASFVQQFESKTEPV
jgi:type I restriction enzyme S subunit